MKFMFPEKGKPLNLQEHLDQLKVLYKNIEPTISKIKNPEALTMYKALSEVVALANEVSFGIQYESVRNPAYPDDTYDEFIASLIEDKKSKIKRVLDLY